MHGLWIFVSSLILIGILTYYYDGFRLLKTVYLILITEPYEQQGTGEQSLLVIGDSTGYGTGVTDKKYSVAGRIGTRYPDLTIENNSVNGRRFDQLRADIPSLSKQYNVILLQLGANDILQNRPLAEVMADLEVVYNALKPNTAHIILMTSGNVGGAPKFTHTPQSHELEERSRTFYAAFAQFASDNQNFTFVDLFEEPIEDPFIQNPERYMAIDDLHPSDDGYGVWFKMLAPVLNDVLLSQSKSF